MKQTLRALLLGAAVLGLGDISHAGIIDHMLELEKQDHPRAPVWHDIPGNGKHMLVSPKTAEYKEAYYTKITAALEKHAPDLKSVTPDFFKAGFFGQHSQYAQHVEEWSKTLDEWCTKENFSDGEKAAKRALFQKSFGLLNTKIYSEFTLGKVQLFNLLIRTWEATKYRDENRYKFVKILVTAPDEDRFRHEYSQLSQQKKDALGIEAQVSADAVYWPSRIQGPNGAFEVEWATFDKPRLLMPKDALVLSYFDKITKCPIAACTPTDYWHELANLYNITELQKTRAQRAVDKFETFMGTCDEIKNLAYDIGATISKVIPKIIRIGFFTPLLVIQGTVNTVEALWNAGVWVVQRENEDRADIVEYCKNGTSVLYKGIKKTVTALGNGALKIYATIDWAAHKLYPGIFDIMDAFKWTTSTAWAGIKQVPAIVKATPAALHNLYAGSILLGTMAVETAAEKAIRLYDWSFAKTIQTTKTLRKGLDWAKATAITMNEDRVASEKLAQEWYVKTGNGLLWTSLNWAKATAITMLEDRIASNELAQEWWVKTGNGLLWAGKAILATPKAILETLKVGGALRKLLTYRPAPGSLSAEDIANWQSGLVQDGFEEEEDEEDFTGVDTLLTTGNLTPQ